MHARGSGLECFRSRGWGLEGFVGGGEMLWCLLLGSLFGAGTMLDRLLELRDLNRGHAGRYWVILRRERFGSLGYHKKRRCRTMWWRQKALGGCAAPETSAWDGREGPS